MNSWTVIYWNAILELLVAVAWLVYDFKIRDVSSLPIMHQDFYAPEVKQNCLKKRYFFQNKIFLKNVFFSNKSAFFQKKFFKPQSFTLMKMLIFSKLFIWLLSRGIIRIESAGKGAPKLEKAKQWLAGKGSTRKRHLCTRVVSRVGFRFGPKFDKIFGLISGLERTFCLKCTKI